MSVFVFWVAAIGVIAGAVGVVSLRDAFYSVLALVVHLICLAALFLLLRAEFVAAVQVVVYAGAVMVLYVFVVAYVGEEAESIGQRLRSAILRGTRTRMIATLGGGALLAELLIALLGSGLKAINSYGAPYHPGAKTFGTPGYIGELLLTRFLVAFEIASFLLLIAAVGAVVLARRRGGIGELAGEGRIAPLHLDRPLGTGTMAEGVEGRMPLAGPSAAQGSGLAQAGSGLAQAGSGHAQEGAKAGSGREREGALR